MSDAIANDPLISIDTLIEHHLTEWKALRHDIHEHPELAYEETRTSGIVAERLKAWGYEVTTGLGGTGVVGQLTLGTGGASIGLRADMDALPIHEQNDLPYKSQTDGKMHACGHDGHTTSLLAAAQLIAKRRNFSGTVNVIFQPAEENLAGAKKMMEAGLFEQYPTQSIFGFHNMPGLPLGQLAFRAGPTMASEDEVDITVKGQGGHGAAPQTAVDPVVVAAHIVTALQTVVSRNVNPLNSAVVTIGAIHGGIARNVIPDEVTLNLTVRSFDKDIRALMKQRITSIATLQAESFGAQVTIHYHHGYPVLINSEKETSLAKEIALNTFEKKQVAESLDPIMASEDFAYMLEEVPGSYLYIGNGESATLHSATYNFNDEILPVAAKYWVNLVEGLLPKDA